MSTTTIHFLFTIMWKLVFCLGLFIISAQALSVQQRSNSCGSASYLTTDNGQVVSHGGIDTNHHYGKNMDCVWTIEAPQGKHVELVAMSFNLESDSRCTYDSLTLHDGPTIVSPEIGKFCGNTFAPVTSTENFLTLHFVTDDDTQLTGFRIFYNFTDDILRTCQSNEYKCGNQKCIAQNYRCDGDDDCGDDSDEQNCALTTLSPSFCQPGQFRCNNSNCIDSAWICDFDNDCGDGSDEVNCYATTTIPVRPSGGCGNLYYNGTSGTLTSPNYPSVYPNNLRCTYTIQAPAGMKAIALKFDDNFNVEPDSTCSYDFVSIHSDGNTFNHGPFCGNQSPGMLTIPGDHAYIEFVTDDSDVNPGFRIDYRAIDQ